ncbi:hypothetical protein [Jannaschia marina]|uniref:hypothetical protein n=1 Tax=Jannaschia marina TaxID=2741674 RepID=UPI0015CAE329|nr:hypothetical protein [Jannaschia marina]
MCSFTTECLSDERCAETDFDLTVSGTAFADPAGDTPIVTDVMLGDLRVLVAGTEDGGETRMLTIAPDGGALMTAHLPEPILTISYIGLCREEG